MKLKNKSHTLYTNKSTMSSFAEFKFLLI